MSHVCQSVRFCAWRFGTFMLPVRHHQRFQGSIRWLQWSSLPFALYPFSHDIDDLVWTASRSGTTLEFSAGNSCTPSWRSAGCPWTQQCWIPSGTTVQYSTVVELYDSAVAMYSTVKSTAETLARLWNLAVVRNFHLMLPDLKVLGVPRYYYVNTTTVCAVRCSLMGDGTRTINQLISIILWYDMIW